MNLKAKKVLVIDLSDETSEVKSYPDLYPYIGGIGIGAKLLEMYADDDPLIFSVGPLNGFFPFASKTSIILNNEGVVEDIYIGGNLSTRIKYAGLDALVLLNSARRPLVMDIQNTNVNFYSQDINTDSLGLPGKRSVIDFDGEKVTQGGYFRAPENFLEQKFTDKRISGLTLTGKETHSVKEFDKYTEIFKKIIARTKELTVQPNLYPSCAGCPMGCGKSKTGEIGGNVMVHSLVACEYANRIYSDIGIVFSCLNVLGYDYTHEDIESLPQLIEETLRKLA